MRIALASLASLPVFFVHALPAQTPVANSAVPPPLRQAASLINDFGNTARYAAENAAVQPPAPGENRVVFMGDSITDNLHSPRFGGFFPGKPYINRGISGQVTGQMLLRFYPDVIALKPKAVIIFAGTNDIGGNIGPVPLETTENNLAAMADLAKANNIKVILATLTPVSDIPGRQGPPMTAGRPPATILELNRWIKTYAAAHNITLLDYFSATVDSNGFFKTGITDDGLHPNAEGYKIMNPLAERAIAQTLGQ